MSRYEQMSVQELDRLIAAEEKHFRGGKKRRAEKAPYHERGTWKVGAGLGKQDQCFKMQLALGSFIALWIVYVIWATWKLSRRGQPASGDTGEHG